MANYCGIFSNEKPKNLEPGNQFISFQYLLNFTNLWLDDIPAAVDLFQRQALKVVENERRLVSNEQLIIESSQLLNNAHRKFDSIEQENLANSVNLDILELFVNSLENRLGDLSVPVDHKHRFYIHLISIYLLLLENKTILEMFEQEYHDCRKAYRQKFEIGSVLDYHLRILQNIESRLNKMEQRIMDTEKEFKRITLFNDFKLELLNMGCQMDPDYGLCDYSRINSTNFKAYIVLNRTLQSDILFQVTALQIKPPSQNKLILNRTFNLCNQNIYVLNDLTSRFMNRLLANFWNSRDLKCPMKAANYNVENILVNTELLPIHLFYTDNSYLAGNGSYIDVAHGVNKTFLTAFAKLQIVKKNNRTSGVIRVCFVNRPK